jgi:hypothetical protein
MHEPGAAQDPIDAALERIRARVARRTRDGVYPAGLDDELDGHFDRIAALAQLDVLDQAATALTRMKEAPPIGIARISTSSRVPGGQHLHRSVQLVIGRQLTGLTEQVERFRADVVTALEAILELIEPVLPATDEAVRQSAVADRASRVDQALVAIRNLEQRVAQLEEREADTPS